MDICGRFQQEKEPNYPDRRVCNQKCEMHSSKGTVDHKTLVNEAARAYISLSRGPITEIARGV